MQQQPGIAWKQEDCPANLFSLPPYFAQHNLPTIFFSNFRRLDDSVQSGSTRCISWINRISHFKDQTQYSIPNLVVLQCGSMVRYFLNNNGVHTFCFLFRLTTNTARNENISLKPLGNGPERFQVSRNAYFQSPTLLIMWISALFFKRLDSNYKDCRIFPAERSFSFTFSRL